MSASDNNSQQQSAPASEEAHPFGVIFSQSSVLFWDETGFFSGKARNFCVFCRNIAEMPPLTRGQFIDLYR
ncbi:hypothetical protein [Novosphingobium lindaniclasticum]|uniref:hypothetical protein n=1 Tax=Novosphingobium lindaniclasticum TaxID=1329895 RepID=UPI001268BFAC|nr:hypothetical protein [Novosphingobium lindaniclasticum]